MQFPRELHNKEVEHAEIGWRTFELSYIIHTFWAESCYESIVGQKKYTLLFEIEL